MGVWVCLSESLQVCLGEKRGGTGVIILEISFGSTTPNKHSNTIGRTEHTGRSSPSLYLPVTLDSICLPCFFSSRKVPHSLSYIFRWGWLKPLICSEKIWIGKQRDVKLKWTVKRVPKKSYLCPCKASHYTCCHTLTSLHTRQYELFRDPCFVNYNTSD